MKPGESIPAENAININEDREAIAISVTNTSDHAVQVTSHYHFFEANKRLQFDRTASLWKTTRRAFGLCSPMAIGGNQEKSG